MDVFWGFHANLDFIEDHVINWEDLELFIDTDLDWIEWTAKCEDYHRRCMEAKENMKFSKYLEKQEKSKQMFFEEDSIFIRKENEDKVLTAVVLAMSKSPVKKQLNEDSKNKSVLKPTIPMSPTIPTSPTFHKPLSWTSDVLQKVSTVGRSLLKSQNLNTTKLLTTAHSLTNSPMNLPNHSSVIKILESDGDSGRSESPQSSRVSDVDTEEDELPIFRHDQINVREKLYEYISDGVAYTSRSEEPEDEVDTRRHYRRKEQENLRPTYTTTYTQSDIKRNAINDHCYHLNEPRNIERSNQRTLSETDEEEIDVVSYEKQTAYVVPVPFKQPMPFKQPLSVKKPAPVKQKRPRGRPPGSTNAQNRKRMAEPHVEQPIAKRARGQRGGGNKNTKNSRTQAYSEDEEDKRNQHNNMERQRRISLMKLFEALKWQVPAISGTERVPKVSVLMQSKKYCDDLNSEERALEFEKEKQKRMSQYLTKKIAELTDHNRRKLMRTSALQRGN